MIQNELVDFGLERCSGQKIADIRIGIRYVAVLLDDGSCGISNSFGDAYSLAPSKYVGAYIGLPAEEAVRLTTSLNLYEAAVGVAAINALAQKDKNDSWAPVNAIDMVNIDGNDTVGIVGVFKPLQKQIQAKAGKVYFFYSKESIDSYPEWSEVMLLPECDVVLVAGITLVNKTIDSTLDKCTKARDIIVLDSTVVPAPDIFRRRNVTVLGGSIVTDSQKILEVVSQGGSGTDIQPYTEMYSIKL